MKENYVDLLPQGKQITYFVYKIIKQSKTASVMRPGIHQSPAPPVRLSNGGRQPEVSHLLQGVEIEVLQVPHAVPQEPGAEQEPAGLRLLL